MWIQTTELGHWELLVVRATWVGTSNLGYISGVSLVSQMNMERNFKSCNVLAFHTRHSWIQHVTRTIQRTQEASGVHPRGGSTGSGTVPIPNYCTPNPYAQFSNFNRLTKAAPCHPCPFDLAISTVRVSGNRNVELRPQISRIHQRCKCQSRTTFHPKTCSGGYHGNQIHKVHQITLSNTQISSEVHSHSICPPVFQTTASSSTCSLSLHTCTRLVETPKYDVHGHVRTRPEWALCLNSTQEASTILEPLETDGKRSLQVDHNNAHRCTEIQSSFARSHCICCTV